MAVTHMKCSRCKEDKDRDEFNNNRSKPTGKSSYCKPCHNETRVRTSAPRTRAYWKAKEKAKKRGIEWEFDRVSWVEWWGEDFAKRGISRDSLQMCRYADSGPYSPSNCFKATCSENARLATAKQWGRLV